MARYTDLELKEISLSFAPLIEEQKTEDEILDAISSDERAFTEKQIQRIYTFLAEPDTPVKGAASAGKKQLNIEDYVFSTRVMDRHDTTKFYAVGDDVPEKYAGELESFLERGIIQEVE